MWKLKKKKSSTWIWGLYLTRGGLFMIRFCHISSHILITLIMHVIKTNPHPFYAQNMRYVFYTPSDCGPVESNKPVSLFFQSVTLCDVWWVINPASPLPFSPSFLLVSIPPSVPPTLFPFSSTLLPLSPLLSPSPRCSSVAPLLFEVFPLPSPSLMVRLKCHSTQGHPTHTAGGEGTIFSAIYLSRTCRINCSPTNLYAQTNAFRCTCPRKDGETGKAATPENHMYPCWFLWNKIPTDQPNDQIKMFTHAYKIW